MYLGENNCFIKNVDEINIYFFVLLSYRSCSCSSFIWMPNAEDANVGGKLASIVSVLFSPTPNSNNASYSSRYCEKNLQTT